MLCLVTNTLIYNCSKQITADINVAARPNENSSLRRKFIFNNGGRRKEISNDPREFPDSYEKVRSG
jgi:hypothetical protein